MGNIKTVYVSKKTYEEINEKGRVKRRKYTYVLIKGGKRYTACERRVGKNFIGYVIVTAG